MRSSFRNLLLTLLIVAFCWTRSLAQDKQNFEKIFEKEDLEKISKGSKRFKNITNLSYYPDTLPSWFFTPPQSTESVVYAIGISDPDMELFKAKELAIHRAEALASVYSKSKLQYFRDIYTTEQQEGKYSNYRQRFDTYFKISSIALTGEETFSVVDTHFTRYNEYLVLIKFDTVPTNKSKIISATGTVLFIEAQVKDAFEVQAEYELKSTFKTIDSKENSAHFLYREKGNKFLTNSVYQSSQIDYPVYIYRYASPLWKENVMPLTCYNGIWSKYVQEFLRYLTLTTEESRKRIKNLGQQYSPENAALTREVASIKASLKLNGIEFAKDSIKFDININEDLDSRK